MLGEHRDRVVEKGEYGLFVGIARSHAPELGKPIGHGIILAGPPGTGKTLLARAVAGECEAHIEIVNGPALLAKWVGETEAAIRAVFERAQKHGASNSWPV